MVNKCCVPKCSNSKFPTNCFKFPSDELLKTAWLKNIPRADKFNTQYVGVCILHFDAKYIKFENEHGKPLVKARLRSDAVRTIFNYNREGVSEVFQFNQDERNTDRIYSFKHFKTEYRNHIKLGDWGMLVDENFVTFYKFKCKNDGCLIVDYNIHIDDEINIKIFNEGECMDFNCFKEIMNRRQHLLLFSELQKIIEKCDDFIDGGVNVPNESDKVEAIKTNLKKAQQYVEAAKNVIESVDDYDYSNCVNIIHDQLVQLTSNRKKYSLNTMLCSYSMYIQSPQTYALIRNWKILILPHASILSRLGKFQDVDPNSNTSNIGYIKKVVANLEVKEKFVIIQMDEIYTDPQVSYWKRLTGFAENVDKVATTVLGVMVSSCFGDMKEIVNLIPMKDGTGADLHRYTLDVIGSLQVIGFIVLAVVTDNNRINQNLFSLLAPDGSFSFQNPNH